MTRSNWLYSNKARPHQPYVRTMSNTTLTLEQVVNILFGLTFALDMPK